MRVLAIALFLHFLSRHLGYALRDGWAQYEAEHIKNILAIDEHPIRSLLSGSVSAVVLRNQVSRAVVKKVLHNLDEELEIPLERVTRYTLYGTTVHNFMQRGSQGYSEYFNVSVPTAESKLKRAFQGIDGKENPQSRFYSGIQDLANNFSVVSIAREPDGSRYSPGVIRIHPVGDSFPTHFDSLHADEWDKVRWKSRCPATKSASHVTGTPRTAQFSISRFSHQLGGIMLLQSAGASADTPSSETVVYQYDYRKGLLGNCRLMGRSHIVGVNFQGFKTILARNKIPKHVISLRPGDMYLFNANNVHQVLPVKGERPRVVFAAFLALNLDAKEIAVWS
uniref:Fe2OG dioxygenase domain-containing protein n=1 Tax=Pyramimonas obovata TaxID=1411642 RepID=A0A7S0RGH0_9CHLO|mmetsp:Transcript_33744/g.73743  ORF Transcript_33744/g.73743 Transcript_33744/m.73743 type:complete len:337 (+) Transcript_33744:84-1094(+)